MVGPRERFAEMCDALRSDGRPLTDDERSRVSAPAGLDLGGAAPAHVAQSIVAEITAVHFDRERTHIRERAGYARDRFTAAE